MRRHHSVRVKSSLLLDILRENPVSAFRVKAQGYGSCVNLMPWAHVITSSLSFFLH